LVAAEHLAHCAADLAERAAVAHRGADRLEQVRVAARGGSQLLEPRRDEPRVARRLTTVRRV
jgi:hypothetical protein